MSALKKLMVCFGIALALAITGWSIADDKAPATPAQPSTQAPAKPAGNEGQEVKKGGKKEQDDDDVQEEHNGGKGEKHEGKEADDD